MTEEWRDVPEFAGRYQASSLGRVRSLDRLVEHANSRQRLHTRRHTGRVLSPGAYSNGRLFVILRDGQHGYNRQVARLVLAAFVGACPPGMECRHLNGNHTDNRIENLAWGTHVENEADKKIHGTGRWPSQRRADLKFIPSGV
jgi:hypothetical protein